MVLGFLVTQAPDYYFQCTMMNSTETFIKIRRKKIKNKKQLYFSNIRFGRKAPCTYQADWDVIVNRVDMLIIQKKKKKTHHPLDFNWRHKASETKLQERAAEKNFLYGAARRETGKDHPAADQINGSVNVWGCEGTHTGRAGALDECASSFGFRRSLHWHK